jgi:signal transduction histidine kinase
MAMIEQVLSEFRNGKIHVYQTESSEVSMLKEYNETLIRKMEDRMLKSEEAEKKIRIYASQLEQEIEQRKQAELELIEALKRAEESDRLKSAFLANMSHEVRTPLNSIIGFSELLSNPEFDQAQKNDFIQYIINSGNNLLAIINDIMDISKLESGELQIYNRQLNVHKFISTVKEQFVVQARAKGLELELILPENSEETIIHADANRLMQIFNNLASNAIKFTSNGRIEIGYQPKGTKIEFYIRDTGIGIAPEYHHKIFERFRQIETSATRKFGGNGLGLAISKNLVELMGGEIWVESEIGKGAKFCFTINH